MDSVILIITMVISGVPAPDVYLPLQNEKVCEIMADKVIAQTVVDNDGKRVIDVKTRCYPLMKA